MSEPKCVIPECEEKAICEEWQFCLGHAPDVIIAVVKASARSEAPNAAPTAQ